MGAESSLLDKAVDPLPAAGATGRAGFAAVLDAALCSGLDDKVGTFSVVVSCKAPNGRDKQENSQRSESDAFTAARALC